MCERMRPWSAVFLVMLVSLGACTTGEPLVCQSRADAVKLLHMACTESFPATHLFDIGSVSASSDEEDMEYERTRVGAYAEWLGIMRPYNLRGVRAITAHKTTPRQNPNTNTVAQHLWPNTVAVAALADDALTLWYIDGTDATTLSTMANTTSVCSRLLDAGAVVGNVLDRHVRMLPLIHAMIMERLFFSQKPACPDMNERLMFDMITHKAKCVCQQDKTCGSAGMRFGVLLTIVIVFAIVIVAIAIAALLYASVRILKDRAAATNVIPLAQPLNWRR